MEKDEYRIMHDIEQTYWWFVGKQFLVRRILQGLPLNKTRQDRILDIGCGTGIILKLLENFGVSYGAECSPDAIQFLRHRGLNLIVQSDVDQSVPFKDNTFSAITCLDVLEHLDNDLKLLKEMGRVCKPGGHVILTVPAFEILWSPHDIALHHKRRYTKQQMLSMISQSNWKVVKCSYYNGILFCPILSIRTLKQCLSRYHPARSDFFINLPAWLNRALSLFFLCEIFLLKYLNLPFGVSLLLILQKSDRA
jgi:ubiquinone/menaquinone biosynthesis C-methylase UbiE